MRIGLLFDRSKIAIHIYMKNDFAIISHMPKPELVLSNTTTFFTGRMESLFKKAKKYGFKYLEIIPYRWTTPEEILALEKKYQIQVDLGAAANSPGLAIAKALAERKPYLLLHADLMDQMGNQVRTLSEQFHVLAENVPYQKNAPRYYWDPAAIPSQFQTGLVFDPGHYKKSALIVPGLDILEAYRKTAPEVVHISYKDRQHTLPNKGEREELRQMLSIHYPRYLVLETNPWVSVKKGKILLEELIR